VLSNVRTERRAARLLWFGERADAGPRRRSHDGKPAPRRHPQ
jgi:hypothetical protein